VRWMRSAAWDGLWILSGLPLGVVLHLITIWTGLSAAVLVIWFVVMLDTGHNISPILVAWTHDGFRDVMLQRKGKYIGLPLVLLAAGTGIGVASNVWWPDYHPFIHGAVSISLWIGHWGSPFAWLLLVYSLWNLYHFGMQNFGVLSIYRQKSGISYPPEQRRMDMAFCLAVQVAVSVSVFIAATGPLWQFTAHAAYLLLALVALGFVLREAAVSGLWCSPRTLFGLSHSLGLIFWPGLLIIAINGFNHWLTAIGIGSHVYGVNKGRSPGIFAGVVIAMGVFLFGVLFWNGRYSWNLRDAIALLLPAMGFRLGLGFVHFCYDRWIYKLGDPQVRGTIGKDVFGFAPMSCERSVTSSSKLKPSADPESRRQKRTFVR
jgi:hypothetical protein